MVGGWKASLWFYQSPFHAQCQAGVNCMFEENRTKQCEKEPVFTSFRVLDGVLFSLTEA